MRPARVLAVRAALLTLVLAGSGCFKPKILPGGFACGDGGTGRGICPDGLVCNPSTNLCVTTIDGSAGSTGIGGAGGKAGQGGKGGAGGMDGGVPDMGPPDRPCLDPVANSSCQPTDAGCDPVCNIGCGQCFEKCSVDTNGDRTCNGISPANQPPVGLLGNCSPVRPVGAPMEQTDNCAAGEICLNASACGVSRCYQFCRANSDCTGGASCSRDGGAYSFCDVPPVVCNPVAGSTSIGCGPGLSCYLSSSGVNTLCDCQFDRSAWPGTAGRPGDPCNRSRDCLSGSVCLLERPIIGKQCFAVCLMPADGGVDTCPGGCQPLEVDGGSKYGWCNN